MLVVGASVLMLAVRVFWLDSLLSNVSHLVLAVRVFGPSLAYSRARVGAFYLIDARGVSLLFIYLFDACLAHVCGTSFSLLDAHVTSLLRLLKKYCFVCNLISNDACHLTYSCHNLHLTYSCHNCREESERRLYLALGN